MKELIKKLFGVFGYELRKAMPSTNISNVDLLIHEKFRDIYKKNPFCFIDIGARDGIVEDWKLFGDYLKVLAFEPDPEEFRRLAKRQEKNIQYFNTALSNERSRFPLYITRGGGQSSSLLPNREFTDKFHHAPIERMDIVNEVIVKADRLDSVLENSSIYDVDFVKLDTQGSEKYILEGAAEVCKSSVFGLEIEAEFVDLYINQPLFAEVDQLVRSYGFYLFDIRRYYWKRSFSEDIKGIKGQLAFCEALYLKKIDLIKESKAKHLKAISLCIYYGYFDYALEILNNAKDIKIVDDTEYKIIARSLENSSRVFKDIRNYDDRRLGNSPWIYG